MCTMTVPASGAEALERLQALVGYLADLDAASLPAAALAELLLGMEQADAVWAVAWARSLAAFDAKEGHQGDGQKTLRAWLVHVARVTRAQAAQYKAIQALAGDHEPLLAGLRAKAVTKSVAVQLAKWTLAIPAEFRGPAEEILIAAAARRGGPAGAGADLRGDPVPDRPAGPRRPRPGAGPGPGPGHDPGRCRGPARRPHPRMRRDGPGGPGRAVGPGREPGTCGPGRSAATMRSRRR